MRLQISKLACVLFVGMWTVATAAQESSVPATQFATIIGTVQDIEEGIIPGARVTLQAAEQQEQQVTSQDDGFFKLGDVKPGVPYHVLVSANGFADWSSPEVRLQPGQFFILSDIKLKIATAQIMVNGMPPEVIAAVQPKAEEKQRAFGFVPNFYVVYEKDAAPLTTKMKFQLAARTLTNPVTMSGFGLNAAVYQMERFPHYGQGAAGYGQRLGVSFASGYSNILGDALFSSLLHQDPRYFYQGTGSTRSRLVHALSNAFLTRGDNGKQGINYSAFGGEMISGGIANATYPSRDRGAKLLLDSFLVGSVARMGMGVLQEFVLHRFTSKSTTQIADPIITQ